MKLPKSLADHPRRDALESFLGAGVAPLRDGGRAVAARWPFDEAVQAALKVAQGTGHLVQGLELIRDRLDREQKGLEAARQKTGQAPTDRMSRLLLLSSDGSERFYHDADSLLARHADRTWGVVLAVSSEELGRALTAKGNPTKAVLIDDKNALGLTLARLVERL